MGVHLQRRKRRKAIEGVPLCEALIQQNKKLIAGGIGGTNSEGELEERVNAHEDSLEGIRNALFSHCEGNLDVLELLLNMPYFPRSSSGGTTSAAATSTAAFSSKSSFSRHGTKLNILADRAYLRLLEDAMFDACEREGEDEMLDDLNMSDVNHDGDSSDVANEDEEVDDGTGRRKKGQSKRAKAS